MVQLQPILAVPNRSALYEFSTHHTTKQTNNNKDKNETEPEPDENPWRMQQDEPLHKQEPEKVKSGRQLFRDLPVHAEILEHIQEIGVGRQPSQNKRTKFNALISDQATGDRRRRAKVVGGLGSVGMPPRPTAPLGRDKRPGGPPPLESSSSSSQQQHQQQQKQAAISEAFKPPRPFGSRSFPVRVVGELADPNQPLPLFLDRIPQSKLPQVALCGRSNVGKSTLLNLLLYSNVAQEQARARRKALEDLQNKKKRRRRHKDALFQLPKGVKATTSDKPGETRHITFYQLGAPHPTLAKQDLRMLLVDLPGYGFAFAKSHEKILFQELMRRYLTGDLPNQNKTTLKRILFLVDARHGFLQADREFLDMIQSTLVSHATAAVQANSETEILQAMVDNEYREDDDDNHGSYLVGDEDDGYEQEEYEDDYEEEEDEEEETEEGWDGERVPKTGRTKSRNNNNKTHLSSSRNERLRQERQKENRLKKQQHRKILQQYQLPPIQLVLTKCDLVSQTDLARRVVQVRTQLSQALVREPTEVLPVMLVSSRTNNGVLELQKQLAQLAEAIDPIPPPSVQNQWHAQPSTLPKVISPDEKRKADRKKRKQQKSARQKARKQKEQLLEVPHGRTGRGIRNRVKRWM